MPDTQTITSDLETGKLVVERVFNAPRELVFAAYTEPDRIAQWWGPREWKTRNVTMDVRPGGIWHYVMTGPDGTEAWGKATYREVTPPSRLVYVDEFSDAEGNANPDLPSTVIDYTFEEIEGGKTRMVSVAEFGTAENLQKVLDMGMIEGMTETLDRLDEFLAA
jgi:uncharacterized protein YndB with AHSA1/START domain